MITTDPDGKPYTHCPDRAERAKRQEECERCESLAHANFGAELDRYHFINCRIAELLELGESWDETSARKEAEQEWETEMRYRELQKEQP